MLAVAVGVYLPLGLSVPIFIGGLIAHKIASKSAGASEEVRQKRENAGLLIASGLITGEALMGVAISIAAVVLANVGGSLPAPMAFAGWTGVVVLIGVIWYQYRKTLDAA